MGNWTISYSERDIAGISVHGVIVVKDENANVVNSFEGLATSASGIPSAIGSSILGYTIKGYDEAGLSANAQSAPVVVFSGSQQQVEARGQAMDAATQQINSENISYELPGPGSILSTVLGGQGTNTNSNSYISTMFQILGIEKPSSQYTTLLGQEGGGATLLTQAQVQNILAPYGGTGFPSVPGSVSTDTGQSAPTSGAFVEGYQQSGGTITDTTLQDPSQSMSVTKGSSGDSVSISGQNFDIELSGGMVNLSSGAAATVVGGNDVINGAGSNTVSISGTNGSSDSVILSGTANLVSLAANVQANVSVSGATINLATGDSSGIYGGGNRINSGANDLVVIANTNGAFDTVNASGDAAGGTTANGQPTGIFLNANAQANVAGNNNGITLASGDSMGAYGGANTINAGAGDLVVVSNTNGAFDTVNASGDAAGGTTANGQPTGVYLSSNAQANLMGSNDAITLASGDSMGAYGGANTINAGAGDLVVIGNTNGAFDSVNATGDKAGSTTANGQGTGIFLNANSQANVTGSNDGITLASGDSMGAYGGANTINAGAGDLVVVGNTNGSSDTINATGDKTGGTTANGQSTGIALNANSQANVIGGNDSISLTNNDKVTVQGTNDTVSGNASDVANYTGGNYSGDTGLGGVSVSDGGTPPPSGGGCTGGSYQDIFTGEFDLNGSPIYQQEWVADPVVLNLAGGAVETSSVKGGDSYFDMQNNGIAIQTGWVTAGEGLLVYSPSDPDGPVVHDSQLVAGFASLHALDSNGDGILNASDAAWNNLRVWIDGGGNGQFHSDALKTLAQLGISSINLDASTVAQNNNGNTILAQSNFTYTNGSSGAIAGVAFVANPSVTEPTAAANLSTLVQAMGSFCPTPMGHSVSSQIEDNVTHTTLLAAAH